MLPNNTNVFAERFIAQPYHDLIIEFLPENKLRKSILHFKIFNYHIKTIEEKKLLENIVLECVNSIPSNKHTITTDKNDSLVCTIMGNKLIGEALTAFLDHTETHPVKERVISEVKVCLEYLQKQIRSEHALKNKNPPHAVKESRNYSVLEKVQNENSIRNVDKVKSLSKKNGHEKTSYSVFRYGDINELASFNSELFALLLGSEHVGKTRTVINEYGIRYRTVSKELPGFESLYDLKDDYNDINEFIMEELIPLGLGKFEVANHVFADNDPHWDNIGIARNKKNQRILARIDFDQALWLITAIYHGINIETAYRTFPEASQYEIDELPNLCQTKPTHSLKKEIPRELLQQVKTHADFVNDKWYAYLKYLLIDDNMLAARANYCISSNDLKRETLACLRERRKQFRDTLLGNISFVKYLLKNQHVIHLITAEFEKENGRYQNNEKKKFLVINSADVSNAYNTILNEAIIFKSTSKNYPESYDKFWIPSRNCETNIIALLNDYNNPDYGWFLTGHWTRSNNERADNIIADLGNLLNPREIQQILLREIAVVAAKPETNLDGSYMKRLEFCCAKMTVICQDLELQNNNIKPVSVLRSI